MTQCSENNNFEYKPSKLQGCKRSIIKTAQYLSIIIMVFFTASLWCSPYNKTWTQAEIYIASDSVSYMTDSLSICNENNSKVQILKTMREKGELLTANEFASRITSYYNTLVAVLGTMFLLFTIATYFSIKQVFENKFDDKERDIDKKQKQIEHDLGNKMKSELQKIENKERDIDKKQEQIEHDLGNKIKTELQDLLRDSRSFRDELVDAVKGNIDGQFVTLEVFDELQSYIKEIKEQQKDIVKQMDCLQERDAASISLDEDSEN